MPDEKRQLDPKPLSTEYHKAHKQLMLWSAILFIWELVGIDLEKAKEAGGNAGAIISAIKSPQAVPWALIIVIAYFLFKTSVEWYQCNSKRRTLRVARIDFATSWIVPITAYALYAYQAIKKVQFADVIQQGKPTRDWTVIGSLLGFVFAMIVSRFFKRRYEALDDFRRWRWSRDETVDALIVVTLFTVMTIALFLAGWWGAGRFDWRQLIGAFMTAVVAIAALEVFLWKVWPFASQVIRRQFSKNSGTDV